MPVLGCLAGQGDWVSAELRRWRFWRMHLEAAAGHRSTRFCSLAGCLLCRRRRRMPTTRYGLHDFQMTRFKPVPQARRLCFLLNWQVHLA